MAGESDATRCESIGTVAAAVDTEYLMESEEGVKSRGEIKGPRW